MSQSQNTKNKDLTPSPEVNVQFGRALRIRSRGCLPDGLRCHPLLLVFAIEAYDVYP